MQTGPDFCLCYYASYCKIILASALLVFFNFPFAFFLETGEIYSSQARLSFL